MAQHEAPREGWLHVEIDGPGASPAEIDGRELLHLATAYFDLLEAVAIRDKQPLHFGPGIRVIDKCVAIALPVAALALRSVVDTSNRWLRREGSIPEGLESRVNATRGALLRLPSMQRARAVTAQWAVDLTATPAPEATQPWVLTSLRAVLRRVGGETPRARFEARGEPAAFMIDVPERALAQRLARSLYRSVEIDVEILRDAQGAIMQGRLHGLREVDETEDPTDAWGRWFDTQRAAWRDVDDIEGAIHSGD